MSRPRIGILDDAPRLLREGIGWAGLGGDGLAYVLARMARWEPAHRWLIVVDDADRSDALIRGLRFFGCKAHPFPADDTQPYGGFSPEPERVHQRLRTLERVASGEPCIVVAPIQALQQRVPGRAVRAQGSVRLAVGALLDRDDLVRQLTAAGYLAAPHVHAPGTVAVRGDVVDIWGAGASRPVRIDFFDDEIESIRRLTRKRTPGRTLERTLLLPAREERVDRDAQRRAGSELSRLVSAQDRGVMMRRRVLEDLRDGVRFSGIESYLPVLVDTVAPLEELSALRCFVHAPEDVTSAARDFWRTTRQRYERLEDEERSLVPPEERYIDPEAVLSELVDAHPVRDIAGDQSIDLGARPAIGFGASGGELGPVARKLLVLLDDGYQVALVARSEKRVEMLYDLLQHHGLVISGSVDPFVLPEKEIAVLIGDLPSGFVSERSRLAYIPADSLFGRRRNATTSDRIHAFFDVAVKSTSQLREGDYVVHKLHGIGGYRGIKRIAVAAGIEQDFVCLEYRGGDRMMLPVTRLGQLSRYQPARSDAVVKLDRLGGITWAKRTGKVRDSLLSMASDLIRLYARREVVVRQPFPEPGESYQAFAACFPHEETPDQTDVIAAVQADLSDEAPMDRLLCGDVGFGKTEVAMRAAMRVVEGGRQVAVLCPTTVLAYQHLQSFRERFADFPVSIGMLSRLNAGADERAVREKLASGGIDIVIGTTAVLGRQVRFKDLGLVVIDEEHRFGVKQKERLKKLRTKVDILSMSATPIPRTLQLALSGVRQMSVMATPPAGRLSVKTSISRFSEVRIRDAIREEIERGGQAFFVHNRVETIGKITEKLQSWLPDARFAIAHGQMDANQLEEVLVGFVRRRTDVLVCTSIVESGIDIPTVNTLLVNRADLFGLAQLYQLRGRVGRSNIRGRCILLAPDDMTRDARKRLRVLVENTRLGAGFHVAAADLELRGAGNILGKAQSGNIDSVGYEMWVSLLDQAVRNARGEMEREQIDPELEIRVPAFIPDDLVHDVGERLLWYQRLANAPSIERVDELLDALENDVGPLPPPVRNLGGLTQARLYCRRLGIERVTWLKHRVQLRLHATTPLGQDALAKVIAEHPKRFADKGDALEVRYTPSEGERPFLTLRWVFTQLLRRVA